MSTPESAALEGLAPLADASDAALAAEEADAANAEAALQPNTGGAATNTPDFYVTSSGTAVPGTGYRAATGQTSVDELATGTISPRLPNGTYITFNNISGMTPAEVQSLLQLPNTPSYWASFDTLPQINNLTIPYGSYGDSDTLEPITSTFPDLGAGGGTQATTNLPITINASGPLSTGGGK